MGAEPAVVLIAGPTASGKSALALQLARERGGVVVNADSMQVYAELAILTARPPPADMQSVPHELYGYVSATEPYSVARWLSDVGSAIARCRASGRCPVIVGGTGLYFSALLEGLSPVPPVPAEIRAHWRALASTAEPGDLHRRLRATDPEMAHRLEPTDTQRLTRALEVMAATGRSLAHWQRQPGRPLVDPAETERIVVHRPRVEIHARCDRRLDAMVEEGALDEVARLLELALSPDAPAMRALGVPQFAAYLRGACTLDAAHAAAKVATRQYVKRQETWLRRRMSDWDHRWRNKRSNTHHSVEQ